MVDKCNFLDADASRSVHENNKANKKKFLYFKNIKNYSLSIFLCDVLQLYTKIKKAVAISILIFSIALDYLFS